MICTDLVSILFIIDGKFHEHYLDSFMNTKRWFSQNILSSLIVCFTGLGFVAAINNAMTIIEIPVVEFLREGYKMRKVFGYKSTLVKRNYWILRIENWRSGELSRVGHHYRKKSGFKDLPALELVFWLWWLLFDIGKHLPHFHQHGVWPNQGCR